MTVWEWAMTVATYACTSCLVIGMIFMESSWWKRQTTDARVVAGMVLFAAWPAVVAVLALRVAPRGLYRVGWCVAWFFRAIGRGSRDLVFGRHAGE